MLSTLFMLRIFMLRKHIEGFDVYLARRVIPLGSFEGDLGSFEGELFY